MGIEIAALFDWDGVVIDSSRHHEESWERLADEEKRDLPPDHFKKGFGMKNEVIIPHMLKWTQDGDEVRRISLRKEELYREVVLEWGIDPLPGVREWLEILRAEEILCVIGSSTHRLNIETALDKLGLRHFFHELVTAEDVSRGKPDPEVFLRAAAKAAQPAERCVVFEDAHVGIDAAKAAKMKVVAVATTHPAAELRAADRVVSRLNELTLNDLRNLLSS
ncbi:MAG: HAD-IA family hydrolase [Verrucomicrobiota bacterium]